jgi:hypothetical protein
MKAKRIDAAQAKEIAALKTEINKRYAVIEKIEKKLPPTTFAPIALQAKQIGSLLQKLFDRLPSKTFPTWCEENFNGGYTNARFYRLLAKHWHLIKDDIKKSTTIMDAALVLLAAQRGNLLAAQRDNLDSKEGEELRVAMADCGEVSAASGKLVKAIGDRMSKACGR